MTPQLHLHLPGKSFKVLKIEDMTFTTVRVIPPSIWLVWNGIEVQTESEREWVDEHFAWRILFEGKMYRYFKHQLGVLLEAYEGGWRDELEAS